MIFSLHKIPLDLQWWAEMPIPGVENDEKHYPSREWTRCPRYRRDSNRFWGRNHIFKANFLLKKKVSVSKMSMTQGLHLGLNSSHH